MNTNCRWCDRTLSESQAKQVPDDLPDGHYEFDNWRFSTCPVCLEEIAHEKS
jgi:uncharacterized protein with PIN domain